MKYTLNTSESHELLKQDPGTATDGGWQSLLVRLQRAYDQQTNQISVTPQLKLRIHRYAFKYGQGGWEDRLLKIFSRHMGPNLDR